MKLSHQIMRSLVAVFCLALPAWAQISDLSRLTDPVPLRTQPYDYSQKARRANFENDLPTRSFELLDGSTIVKRQQSYQGVPVWGAELIDHYQGQQHLASRGRFARLYALKTEPTLDKTSAIDSLKTFFDTQHASAELMIYPSRGRSYLVWMIREQNLASNWHVFVDAHNGDIINAYQSIHNGTGTGILGDIKEVESSGSSGNFVLDHTEHGVRRITYSANNQRVIPGTLMSDGDDLWDAASQASAVDAHHYTGLTLDFLRDHLNRSSYTNQGTNVVSTVNYGVNYVNAFWNGSQMVYGDGDNFSAVPLSASFDIVAHELGHAVTDWTSRLIYQNLSGALNESFSDILGAAAEYYYQPEQFDWMIGEDCWTPGISGDAIRYMYDPSIDGSSRDHWQALYTGYGDNGGVHINSGIPNLAFYLTVEGGQHPRALNYDNQHIRVSPIGMDAALHIFYQAFISLNPAADFIEARNNCINAAHALYGDFEAAAIANAWAAVGVGDPVDSVLPNNGILTQSQTLNSLAADRGEWLELQINIPVNATNLSVRSFGGAGDADLYLRYSAKPTLTDYTQRPYRSGNDETILEVEPATGIWYISLYAYNPFEDLSLEVDFDLPDDIVPAEPNQTLNLTDLNALENEWLHYTVEVYDARPMRIELSGGDGDADLYVKFAAQPESNDWDYRPFNEGNEESVQIDRAFVGTWHISINAYRAFSGVSLQVSYPD